jgi:hypothetical protein
MINSSLHQSKPENSVYNYSFATEKEMSLTAMSSPSMRIHHKTCCKILTFNPSAPELKA